MNLICQIHCYGNLVSYSCDIRKYEKMGPHHILLYLQANKCPTLLKTTLGWSELLVYNAKWIADNQLTYVVNFHQEFMTRMYSDFFQGQTNRESILLA